MDKEQKDYVKKQEARKARGRYHRAKNEQPDFTDFSHETHENIFNDFFTVSRHTI